MDPVLGAAMIAAGGAVAGAIVQALFPPNSISLTLRRVPRSSRMIGAWDSWWSPDPANLKRFHEVIKITKQHGDRVWGQSTRDEEPNKLWELAGRYDGHYLQLYYYPSRTSPDSDFLDYGCYFLVKRTDGTLVGYSAGLGPTEDTGADSLTADNHLMKRKPQAAK